MCAAGCAHVRVCVCVQVCVCMCMCAAGCAHVRVCIVCLCTCSVCMCVHIPKGVCVFQYESVHTYMSTLTGSRTVGIKAGSRMPTRT